MHYLILIILYITFTSAFAKTDIWLEKALALQREMDLNTPLNEVTFLGTHNSYNSKYYASPLTRYPDPNQSLSIYAQLDAGARSIELDAHWTYTSGLKKDILLCHADDSHLGCSTADRHISEALTELRNWLKANPNEIVLLYIDRHLDGHEPRLAALLEEYLHHYIYQPSMLRDTVDHSCLALPSQLTKAAILKAGKQLLIIVKGCDGDDAHYEEQNKFNQDWNDIVFAGSGDIPSKPYNFIDAKIEHFLEQSDCGKSTVFYADPDHTSLWRIFEDRTMNGNFPVRHKQLTSNDMRSLIQCGVNWPTVDMLTYNDSRLNAAVWSWVPSYPKAGHGKCAILKTESGIENATCDQLKSGYACRSEYSHEIKIIPMIGPWTNGEGVCQFLAGRDWHFSTPHNGAQIAKLKTSMSIWLLREIWLNYAEDNQRHWQVIN